MIRHLLGLGLCLLAFAAHAGERAQTTRHALESGQFAEGEKQLVAVLAGDPHDDEALLGLGMLRIGAAVERFGQAQVRYGLRFETLASPLSILAPNRMDRPPENAEDPSRRLSYEQQRATLQTLLVDLARAEQALAQMGDRPAKIALDLGAIRFRATPDASPEPNLTLGSMLTGRRGDRSPASAPEPFPAVFDNADALWLRAYTHLLSAALELALAYDWRDSFDRYAGLFYWGAKRPAKPWEKPDAAAGFLTDDIFDFVGFLHSMRWRCAEPERVRAAKRHLKMLVVLNRQMWPLVLARTDDDKNWIPGPQQHNSALASLVVTDEIVKAWRDNIEVFDAVLDGKMLLPHWRYAWGLDLGKVFDEPPDFDAVDWFAGAPTIPYLRLGPTIEASKWRTITGPFGPNFLVYSLWLN